MTRFFVRPEHIRQDLATLDAGDAHHLRIVLKARAGDSLTVLDGTGAEWPGIIEEISKSSVTVRLGTAISPPTESRTRITVAQALPKISEKLEEVLQHGTEIGASAFQIFQSTRSQIHLSGERQAKRMTRWQAIIKTAAEQSHRALLPTVRADQSLGDVLVHANKYDLALLADPNMPDGSLRDTLMARPVAPQSTLVVVGPGERFYGIGSKPGTQGWAGLHLPRPAYPEDRDGGICDAVTNLICLGIGLPLFVDIHNHILPGIDDGAETVNEAIRMAKMAVADGTDTLVATPHRRWPRRDDANPIWVSEKVAQLQATLDAEKIPLELITGVEIPMSRTLVEDLKSGIVGTLGGGRWTLIEPPFDRIPQDAFDLMQSVRTAGYEIVLAHPERNAGVQRDFAFLEACAGLGMVFQLTSGSLVGRFGPLVKRTAENILAHADQWPLVIASDTHDLDVRAPNLMAAARDAAAKVVGMEQAQAMVDSRPRSIVTAG